MRNENFGTRADERYADDSYSLTGVNLRGVYKNVCGRLISESRPVLISDKSMVFEEPHHGPHNDSRVRVFYDENASFNSSGYVSLKFGSVVEEGELSHEAKNLRNLTRKIAKENGFKFEELDYGGK